MKTMSGRCCGSEVHGGMAALFCGPRVQEAPGHWGLEASSGRYTCRVTQSTPDSKG